MNHYNWQTITMYAKNLKTSYCRARVLASRLPDKYKLVHSSGRLCMIRADAPDIRKPNGRPRAK